MNNHGDVLLSSLCTNGALKGVLIGENLSPDLIEHANIKFHWNLHNSMHDNSLGLVFRHLATNSTINYTFMLTEHKPKK